MANTSSEESSKEIGEDAARTESNILQNEENETISQHSLNADESDVPATSGSNVAVEAEANISSNEIKGTISQSDINEAQPIAADTSGADDTPKQEENKAQDSEGSTSPQTNSLSNTLNQTHLNKDRPVDETNTLDDQMKSNEDLQDNLNAEQSNFTTGEVVPQEEKLEASGENIKTAHETDGQLIQQDEKVVQQEEAAMLQGGEIIQHAEQLKHHGKEIARCGEQIVQHGEELIKQGEQLAKYEKVQSRQISISSQGRNTNESRPQIGQLGEQAESMQNILDLPQNDTEANEIGSETQINPDSNVKDAISQDKTSAERMQEPRPVAEGRNTEMENIALADTNVKADQPIDEDVLPMTPTAIDGDKIRLSVVDPTQVMESANEVSSIQNGTDAPIATDSLPTAPQISLNQEADEEVLPMTPISNDGDKIRLSVVDPTQVMESASEVSSIENGTDTSIGTDSLSTVPQINPSQETYEDVLPMAPVAIDGDKIRLSVVDPTQVRDAVAASSKIQNAPIGMKISATEDNQRDPQSDIIPGANEIQSPNGSSAMSMVTGNIDPLLQEPDTISQTPKQSEEFAPAAAPRETRALLSCFSKVPDAGSKGSGRQDTVDETSVNNYNADLENIGAAEPALKPLKSVPAVSRCEGSELKTVYSYDDSKEQIEVFVDGKMRAMVVTSIVGDSYVSDWKDCDLPTSKRIRAETEIKANGSSFRTVRICDGRVDQISIYKNGTLMYRIGNRAVGAILS